MKITIDFTNKDIALLKKGLALENQWRRSLAATLQSHNQLEQAAIFRRDLALDEYIHATLMNTVEDEVEPKRNKTEQGGHPQ